MGEVGVCAGCARFGSDFNPNRKGACMAAPLLHNGKIVAYRAVFPSAKTGIMPWCPYRQKEGNDVPRK